MLAGAASTASGDGLPVPFDGGDNAGVASRDGDFRYATVAAGGDTAVVKIATGSGEILRSTVLPGDYGVPLVAYDGTAQWPLGRRADAGRDRAAADAFRGRRRPSPSSTPPSSSCASGSHCDGDFSFDALSPDGRSMYLIRVPGPARPDRLPRCASTTSSAGELLPDPIVDPNESGEEMAGFPQTRATSPDGRWAYTLYEPAERDHPPFIHALDTQRGTAVCIDLDLLAAHRQVWRLGLQPSVDGSSLAVIDRGEPIASVDLKSSSVSEPIAEPVASDDPGAPWGAIVAGLALLAAVCAVLVRRLRARGVGREGGECEPAR